jgi:hypothetical protein
VWKALTRRSHTHIASRVSTFGERGVEGLRLMNSRVAKGTCAKARLWSHGDVRLAPGVKLRRAGFHEGPVDSFKGFQQESEEPFRLRRRSIQRPGGRRTLLR